MNYKIIDLKSNESENALLIACEKNQNCPFEIKRIFYIYNTNNECIRGNHANKNSQFLFIMMNGSCKIKIDDGKSTEIINLKEKHKALYIDKMIWKQMYDFSKDAILLVLTNTHYDKNEYIKDYEEFKKLMGGGVREFLNPYSKVA
ncbi:WxcM-like domain-containing protein [Campylobacter sp. MIT 99-7217]|uniref:sugar 3,4-ketoisomerase n=1 Tax=Campylobacter sp. MIT 99-7217 TaxID=535091 RepID=UPI0011598008|nr:FdtA/QdtA family cupin domain-containing protein [Campylobacter sp. MIT 99-7217]TQR33745.1 WxcM-like domain-containing protein [Campylobacter sp. MIT 99-7217]